MTADDPIRRDVIAELHRAIHCASQDYFIWSGGHILYDKGVEAVMQVYAAKRLFDVFSPRHEVIVHLERSRTELVPTLSGRVDMTLQFNNGTLYAIEFKRYSNPAQTGPDLARLPQIATTHDRVGLFAAPCYMRGERNDWTVQDQANHASDSSQIWHLSERQKLPDGFLHKDGWSHERALVIEVCRSSNP